MRLSRFVFMSGAGLVGCAGDQPPGARADSSSIPEVRNAAADVAAAPALVLEEMLRIGTVGGPEEPRFERVVGIDEGADGSIIVLDQRAASVRIFDRVGALVRSFGRRGQGPGEFGVPRWLAVGGDTIVVVEASQPRLFSADGHPLPGRYGTTRVGLLPELTRTPAGWLAAPRASLRPLRGERGPYRDTIVVRPIEVGTGVLGEPILRIPWIETYVLGPVGFHIYPFMAPEPRVAIAVSGWIFATAGDEYVIDMYSPRGELVRRIVAEVQRVPVTRSEYEREVAIQLERYKGASAEDEAGAMARILREDYPSLPHSRYRPVIGAMLAAPDGRLLVERRDLDPSPFEWIPPPPPERDFAVWDLFDATGRIAGRLTIPATLRATPRRLTDSALYAVARDSLDVEYVVRYRLARR